VGESLVAVEVVCRLRPRRNTHRLATHPLVTGIGSHTRSWFSFFSLTNRNLDHSAKAIEIEVRQLWIGDVSMLAIAGLLLVLVAFTELPEGNPGVNVLGLRHFLESVELLLSWSR
jgi:hypothetical protein